MAVKKLEITERGPYAGGQTFGDTGAYEQLDGTVHFAVDPADAANSLITDIGLAPRNSAGLVEFSADFRIVKPVDAQKGSHKLFFDGQLIGDSARHAIVEACRAQIARAAER